MRSIIFLITCLSLVVLFSGCTSNPLFTLLPEPAVNTSTSGGGTSTTTSTNTSSTTYIGNVNTFKFHKTTCGSLPDPINRTYFSSRAAAVSAGYIPCGICKP